MNKLDDIFAALSDSTRRRIVDRLTHGPATVNEIAEPFKISQQAISKHLAYLERAKLIEKHREGRQQFCTLSLDGIRAVADWADGYRKHWDARFKRLDIILEEMKVAQRDEKKAGHLKGKRSNR